MTEQPDQKDEEWISAAAAVALLDIGSRLGRRTICQHAHAGLIKARARRFIHDRRVADNVDIPPGFWWAEGKTALDQNWVTGDFTTRIGHTTRQQAFGVTFRRADIELAKPVAFTPPSTLKERQTMTAAGEKVFIGHGHSLVWRELSEFIEKRLHLQVDHFNSISVAGVSITTRLEEMLNAAAFAFLVMTGEDELPDGKLQARLNVVHEAGLFQGRLGFKKAILLLEEGCEDFSNIHGLNHISFSNGQIRATFEEVRAVLEREGLVTSEPPGALPERTGRSFYTHSRNPRD